jgi:hypothetical protein
MITAIPEGGLCNRMRAMASAIIVARRAKVPLKVLWYRTPDFNCRFEALFSTAGIYCHLEERQAMSRLTRGAFRIREACLRIVGTKVYVPKDVGKDFDADQLVLAAAHHEIYVRTYSRLVTEAGMYGCFRPVGVPAKQLTGLLQTVQGAVGVHIRRTDNVKATARSRLADFLQLMEAEVESDPNVTFFVASDSPDAVAELNTRFGQRIFVYQKRAYRRDDPAAIEDAVVDLFCLSHCRKLIGSYWSSFTDTAHELSGIDYVIAGDPD